MSVYRHPVKQTAAYRVIVMHCSYMSYLFGCTVIKSSQLLLLVILLILTSAILWFTKRTAAIKEVVNPVWFHFSLYQIYCHEKCTCLGSCGDTYTKTDTTPILNSLILLALSGGERLVGLWSNQMWEKWLPALWVLTQSEFLKFPLFCIWALYMVCLQVCVCWPSAIKCGCKTVCVSVWDSLH